MKHKVEDCKVKLRAIHKLASQIKAGMKVDDIESHVIVMLAEQIQYHTELLVQEEE